MCSAQAPSWAAPASSVRRMRAGSLLPSGQPLHSTKGDWAYQASQPRLPCSKSSQKIHAGSALSQSEPRAGATNRSAQPRTKALAAPLLDRGSTA